MSVLISLSEVIMDQLVEDFACEVRNLENAMIFVNPFGEEVARYSVTDKTLSMGLDYEVLLVGNTVVYGGASQTGISMFDRFLQSFKAPEPLPEKEEQRSLSEMKLLRCGEHMVRMEVKELYSMTFNEKVVGVEFDVRGSMNYLGFHPGIARKVLREFHKLQKENMIIVWSAYTADGKGDRRHRAYKKLANYQIDGNYVWLPPNVTF